MCCLAAIEMEGQQSTQHTQSEEDRISELPNCLLIFEILSRLPDTTYAIRTGALSKQWQHLWTEVPNLIFSYFPKYNVPQFHSSVERIISEHGQSNLKKFTLYSFVHPYTNETTSQVGRCIRNAIDHNVQEVDLHLLPGFVLPGFFLVCPSFIHLKLRYCRFQQAAIISWENLKSLCIEYVELDQNVFENILSGSPLLETLELGSIQGLGRINVTNKSVNNLVLSGYLNHIFEINAPYISSLAFKGRLLEKLKLLNVSSGIIAELDYDVEMHQEMLRRLILSLAHVKEVKIGKRCLEALACLKAKDFIFPSNLKFL